MEWGGVEVRSKTDKQVREWQGTVTSMDSLASAWLLAPGCAVQPSTRRISSFNTSCCLDYQCPWDLLLDAMIEKKSDTDDDKQYLFLGVMPQTEETK